MKYFHFHAVKQSPFSRAYVQCYAHYWEWVWRSGWSPSTPHLPFKGGHVVPGQSPHFISLAAVVDSVVYTGPKLGQAYFRLKLDLEPDLKAFHINSPWQQSLKRLSICSCSLIPRAALPPTFLNPGSSAILILWAIPHSPNKFCYLLQNLLSPPNTRSQFIGKLVACNQGILIQPVISFFPPWSSLIWPN